VRVHCGIGSTSADREQLPRAKWEAEAVLEVIRSDPSTRSVGDVAEHRSRALAGLVAELVKGDERFRHGVVYAVADHDRRHRTDYLTTLAAYVRAQGDIARASGTLGVHPNTLRYRLSRMSDLFGLDPSDPDERFVADLQLRLMDLDAGERAPVTGAGD
ncbi:MAG: PucR family transcriptional regulator, partial [Acidimicrobiales bacterium]